MKGFKGLCSARDPSAGLSFGASDINVESCSPTLREF